MSNKRRTPAKGPARESRGVSPANRKRLSGPRVPNPTLPEILQALQQAYPDAHCELEHSNAFELLIATILSAQCTDVRVNIVTKDLFAKYRGPRAFAEVPIEELEADIRSTGTYRMKARNIQKACRTILDEHAGEVPRTMEELTALGGVGRKTANVVLGNIWNEPDGVVVDTHVQRLSRKLGLTENDDPVRIERDLNAIVPREHWVMLPHWLIWHGRRVCKARSPECEECVLYAYCPTRA
jgi:endonuclease III